MSHKASAWAIRQRPNSAHQKLVLMILADYHNNQTGLCFPSAVTVSDLAMCSEKTVRVAISDLEEQGFISRIKRPGRTAQIDFNWGMTPEALTGVENTVGGKPYVSRDSGQSKSTPEAPTGVSLEIDNPGSSYRGTPVSDDHNPGNSYRRTRY